MPAGRYLFIPFLRTKSQKRQTKNWSSEKSHKKKTDRTNIIATNFVWEQLKIFSQQLNSLLRTQSNKTIGLPLLHLLLWKDSELTQTKCFGPKKSHFEHLIFPLWRHTRFLTNFSVLNYNLKSNPTKWIQSDLDVPLIIELDKSVLKQMSLLLHYNGPP